VHAYYWAFRALSNVLLVEGLLEETPLKSSAPLDIGAAQKNPPSMSKIPRVRLLPNKSAS
jgi:hypothetical protein